MNKKNLFLLWFTIILFVFVGWIYHSISTRNQPQTGVTIVNPADANSVQNAPSVTADGDGLIVKEGKATVKFAAPSPTNQGFVPESTVKAFQRSSN